MIGILFTLERNLFIREEAENLPFLIRLMASWTGLLSGRIIMGSLDSLRMGYSASMAVARLSASTSQQLHFLVCSLSLAEW